MAGQKHILVYAARHGTTDLNQADAFRGPVNAPLDAEGERDAHQLAHYFEPIELSHIFSSDKIRTTQTAKIIAQAKGLTSIPHHDLRAWDVGDLGGEPKNEANLELVDWHVEHPDVPLPGGESLNQFKDRLRPLVAEAIDAAMEIGIPILLVVHSSVIHEIGAMLANDHHHTLVEPGGVAAIYAQNGVVDAAPIFKPRPRGTSRGELHT